METLLNELSTLGKGKNEQLMEQLAKDYDITVQYTRQNNDDLFHTQQLLVYLIWLTLDRQKKFKMEDSFEKTFYHSCYTRNNEGTNIRIRYEKGEQCITGGTNNSFWVRKLYQNTERNRQCKKKTACIFKFFQDINNGIIKKVPKNYLKAMETMKIINTYTSILYTVQLMSFYLKQKDVIIGTVIVYILEKNSFCLVCKFNRDLTTYYETEQETINKKSKILKIYRALMTFIYMIRYWNIISPHLMSNFNFFGSIWHRCFKYVNSY